MLKNSAKRVQEAINNLGLEFTVREYPSTTRTATDAAATIGCEVGAIVKSLIFMTTEEPVEPILILVSGANRVDENKIMQETGLKLTKANAEFIRIKSGYAIGGIPPIGHNTKLITFIDRDLLLYEEIWAAAGTPNAVFSLPSHKLANLTAGKIISVKK